MTAGCIHCFTCGEWVGLSGVDLRGTPRSKADAHYLGGPPESIREVGDETRETLVALAIQVRDDLPMVDTLDEAAEFVADELERVRAGLDDRDEANEGDD